MIRKTGDYYYTTDGGGEDVASEVAAADSANDSADAANIKKSDAQFKQKLHNGDFNTPNDPKQLKELADFINANKQNNYLNVQPADAMNVYHPEFRSVRMNIYLDTITYAKLMELVGDHNPADDYGKNE